MTKPVYHTPDDDASASLEGWTSPEAYWAAIESPPAEPADLDMVADEPNPLRAWAQGLFWAALVVVVFGPLAVTLFRSVW